MHEAALAKLQVTLQEAQQAKVAAEQEASQLKVRLATAEERANMMQARQEEHFLLSHVVLGLKLV